MYCSLIEFDVHLPMQPSEFMKSLNFEIISRKKLQKKNHLKIGFYS